MAPAANPAAASRGPSAALRLRRLQRCAEDRTEEAQAFQTSARCFVSDSLQLIGPAAHAEEAEGLLAAVRGCCERVGDFKDRVATDLEDARSLSRSCEGWAEAEAVVATIEEQRAEADSLSGLLDNLLEDLGDDGGPAPQDASDPSPFGNAASPVFDELDLCYSAGPRSPPPALRSTGLLSSDSLDPGLAPSPSESARLAPSPSGTLEAGADVACATSEEAAEAGPRAAAEAAPREAMVLEDEGSIDDEVPVVPWGAGAKEASAEAARGASEEAAGAEPTAAAVAPPAETALEQEEAVGEEVPTVPGGAEVEEASAGVSAQATSCAAGEAAPEEAREEEEEEDKEKADAPEDGKASAEACVEATKLEVVEAAAEEDLEAREEAVEALKVPLLDLVHALAAEAEQLPEFELGLHSPGFEAVSGLELSPSSAAVVELAIEAAARPGSDPPAAQAEQSPLAAEAEPLLPGGGAAESAAGEALSLQSDDAGRAEAEAEQRAEDPPERARGAEAASERGSTRDQLGDYAPLVEVPEAAVCAEQRTEDPPERAQCAEAAAECGSTRDLLGDYSPLVEVPGAAVSLGSLPSDLPPGLDTIFAEEVRDLSQTILWYGESGSETGGTPSSEAVHGRTAVELPGTSQTATAAPSGGSGGSEGETTRTPPSEATAAMASNSSDSPASQPSQASTATIARAAEGAWAGKSERPGLGHPIKLHIYDVSRHPSIQWINTVFANKHSPVKFGGLFHVGVEVNGREWSFGHCPVGTGVGSSPPRAEGSHNFRETYSLPDSRLSEAEINEVIALLQVEYVGQSYNLFHRNCCHFADELCQRLGVGQIPAWVYRLATIGGSAVQALGGLDDQVGVLRLSRSSAAGVPAALIAAAKQPAPAALPAPPPAEGTTRDRGTSREGVPL